MIRTSLILLFSAALPGTGIAQSSSGMLEVRLANEAIDGKIPFYEELLDAARISGAVVAGVQVMEPAHGIADLRAHIPTSWIGGEMCVRVVSADGLYEAVNTYEISQSPTGSESPPPLPEVPFETKYTDVLSEAGANGLAIRITRGRCYEGHSDEATLAFVNMVSAPSVKLLVNSFRAARVFAYVDDGAPTQCEPIQAQTRIAYDVVCVLEDLPAKDSVEVEIYRVRESGSPDADTVLIQLPGSS